MPSPFDGRCLRRRQRLISELRAGRRNRGSAPLKPIDVLVRSQQLLDMGASVREICRETRSYRYHIPNGREVVEVLRGVQRAYGFRPEAYQCLGLPGEVLVRAGLRPTAEAA